MSRYVVIGVTVMLLGVAAIVGGALLLAGDASRQGAGLGLVFGGVVLDFIGLFVATTTLRRNGAKGNGGNVPSTISNLFS
jgi:hypothetical protein